MGKNSNDRSRWYTWVYPLPQNCAGGEIINDASDERYSEDGDNVIFGEKRYWYESIDLVYMPESQKS